MVERSLVSRRWSRVFVWYKTPGLLIWVCCRLDGFLVPVDTNIMIVHGKNAAASTTSLSLQPALSAAYPDRELPV